MVRAMFSGIVEEMGSVASLVKNPAVKLWDGSVGEGFELTVRAKTVLDGASDGCSIAVNGVCLTVTSFDEERFKVGVSRGGVVVPRAPPPGGGCPAGRRSPGAGGGIVFFFW